MTVPSTFALAVKHVPLATLAPNEAEASVTDSRAYTEVGELGLAGKGTRLAELDSAIQNCWFWWYIEGALRLSRPTWSLGSWVQSPRPPFWQNSATPFCR